MLLNLVALPGVGAGEGFGFLHDRAGNPAMVALVAPRLPMSVVLNSALPADPASLQCVGWFES